MMAPKHFAEARLAAYAHIQVELSPRKAGSPRSSVEGKVVRVFAVRGASPKKGERISFPVLTSDNDDALGEIAMPSEEAWARARVVEAYLDADASGWRLVRGQLTLLRRATTEPVNPADAESFGVAEGPGLWSDTADDDASRAAQPGGRTSILAWWRVQPRATQVLSAAAVLLVVGAIARTILPVTQSGTVEQPLPHSDPTVALRRFIANPSSADSLLDPFDPLEDVTEVTIENDAVRGRVARFRWRRLDTMVALLDTYDSPESARRTFAESEPGRNEQPLIKRDGSAETYTFGYTSGVPSDGATYLDFHCARRAELFACSVIPDGVPAILTLVYSKGDPSGLREITDAARSAIGQLGDLGI